MAPLFNQNFLTWSNPSINRGGSVLPVVSGLIAHYDAADLTTIDKDGSDLVSEWRNKVVDDLFTMTQATGANKPTWISAGQNGYDVIRCAASDFMTSGAFTDVDQPLTFFWAVKFPAESTSIRELIRGVSGTTIQIGLGNSATRSNQLFSQMDSDLMDGDAEVGIQSSWHLVRHIMNGASSSFEYDGAASGTGGQGATKFRQFKFSSSTSASSWIGDYGEILIYDEVVSSGDTGLIETYLQDKWATPALP